jgi:ABC-type transport system substrate-binding protein
MVFTEGQGDPQFLYTAPNEMLARLPIDTAALPPRAWQPAEQLPVLIASMRDLEPQLEPWLELIWANSSTADIDLGPFPEPTASENLQVITFGEPWQDSRLHGILLYAVDWSLITEELFREPTQVEVIHQDPEGNQTQISPDGREVVYDPEQAKALMAEAGYPEGMRMGLMVPDGDEVLLKTAEVITEQMSAIDIFVEIVEQSELPTLSRAAAVSTSVPLFMLSLEGTNPIQ